MIQNPNPKLPLPETRPRLKQIKKGKEGVENVKKGARTILIRQTLRSRATDEGRSTIFFLPKLLVIADLRSHQKKIGKNAIFGSACIHAPPP